MLKITSYITYPILIIIISSFIMAGCQPFYHYQFQKNDTAQVVDLPAEHLPVVIDRLSGYVVGRYDQFNYRLTIDGQLKEVYGERETAHMVDVRRIFDALKIIAVGIALIVIVSGYFMRRSLASYAVQLTRAGCLGVIAITLLLVALISADFSRYFVVFHELFFDNDLWILNPQTDVLIQMLPEVFFRDIAIAIITVAIVIAAVGWLLASRYAKRYGGYHD